MYLSQNLKYLREQKGFSQRELSDVLGLSGSAVAMWEQRHRTPDIETIIKLAGYFEVTLDEFVLRDLRPPIPIYAINLQQAIIESSEVILNSRAEIEGKWRSTIPKLKEKSSWPANRRCTHPRKRRQRALDSRQIQSRNPLTV